MVPMPKPPLTSNRHERGVYRAEFMGNEHVQLNSYDATGRWVRHTVVFAADANDETLETEWRWLDEHYPEQPRLTLHAR
jgi:hypothetical protein